MLGLRESELPPSAIGSPQQMQIRGVMGIPQANLEPPDGPRVWFEPISALEKV
jgi:hypothetical protein